MTSATPARPVQALLAWPLVLIGAAALHWTVLVPVIDRAGSSAAALINLLWLAILGAVIAAGGAGLLRPTRPGGSVLAIGIAVALGLPFAARAESANAQLAERVLRNCGYDRAFASVSGRIEEAFAREKAWLSQVQADALAGALRSAFAGERLRATVLQHLESAISPPYLQQVLKFCESPLGTRVSSLELEVPRLGDAASLSKLVAGFRESVSGDRLKLLERLDEASAATDLAMAIVEETTVAVASVAGSMSSSWKPSVVPEIRRQFAARAPYVRSFVREAIVAAMGVIYSSLGRMELTQVVGFYETPAARALSKELSAGLVESISRSTATVLGSLAGNQSPLVPVPSTAPDKPFTGRSRPFTVPPSYF